MNRRLISAAAFLFASGAAAQKPIPIRTLSPPAATSSRSFSLLWNVRELAGGRLLVNDPVLRQIVVLDGALALADIVADSAAGAKQAYPAGPRPRFIPYIGDSTIMVDGQAGTLLILDPNGKIARAAAAPIPQHLQNLLMASPAGVDSRGRLLYQTPPPAGNTPFALGRQCTPGVPAPPLAGRSDSALILRADFNTRTADTIAKARAPGAPLTGFRPARTSDCRITAVRNVLNPVPPSIDAWVVTSDGSLAIVRGLTYHIDWVDADGTRRTTPKIPFAWRRLTDAEKQQKIDSASVIVDSVRKAGGYEIRVCALNGNDMLLPPAPAGAAPNPRAGADAGGGTRGGGGGGRGGGDGAGGGPPAVTDCREMTQAVEFVPLSEMPDYMPPIRGGSVLADLDGNVWIIPATSVDAKGGLLYDVVNRKGELVERVQLPADRTVAAFGKGGVVYLGLFDATSGKWTLERRTIRR